MEMRTNDVKEITNTGAAAKRKKPFWGKPNWFAALLVAVLLVGGWSYLGGDLSLYYQACQARAVLAESAEKAILNAADTTPIDLSRVKREAEMVDNMIQTLADKTDLGEYLAKEDMTTEGREHNKVVMYSMFAMFAAGGLYLVKQVIQVVVLIKKGRGKKEKHSCQSGAAV